MQAVLEATNFSVTTLLNEDVTKANIQGIVDRVRERDAEVRIVIAGMKIPPNMGPEYAERFQALHAEVAKDNDLPLIPFVLEGVGGIPELNLPDGIHPTPEGHAIVAETVWKPLEPILRGLTEATDEEDEVPTP